MTTRRTLLGGGLLGAAGLAGLLGGCGRGPSSDRPAGVRSSTHAYGRDRAQVARLLLPDGTARCVVLLVHGGYWQPGYDLHLEDRCADDLAAAGWAVWNLDYRAVGRGGGWPGTFTDVATGADELLDVAAEHAPPLDRVVAVGHSAGGALALWLAARHR
ncbi:alpha/beta hydrolase, partial [Angustibacter aerolatus]